MRSTSIHRFAFALTATLAITTSSVAQDADPLRPRLDRAHQYQAMNQRIRDNVLVPRWLKEDGKFVYWAGVGPHAGSWVVVDARRRSADPVLPPAELRSRLTALIGREARIPPILGFALAPDSQRIVFRLEDRAFVLGISDGRLAVIEDGDPLMRALPGGGLLAPGGGMVAEERDGGFAVSGAGGRALLERSGEENYAWQMPERAWSPDGRHLAVWRTDARGVHMIPIVDYDSAVERVRMVPYPKTGTPLPRPGLYVVEPSAGRVTQVASSAEESYAWLAGWRPDGSEALVLRLSRDGKRLDLEAVSPATGAVRRVLREERPESFVGALDFTEEGWRTQVTPFPDGRGFLWMSERDGWRHVYLYDWAGTLLRRVTTGAFPVHEVHGVTPDGGSLLVTASADSAAPYDRHPFRVALASGAMTRLAGEPGVHRVFPSSSGRYYVDGHSARSRPRAWEAGRTEGGAPFRYAQADASALAEIGFALPDSLVVTAADGVTRLYGALYKPSDFDPRKRYAVVDFIYAGPWLSVVSWGYGGRGMAASAHALAEMGFVVMMLDARGTPGRSKAFQDANYGRVGQTEIPDHVAALRQAAATRPWMDLERAGIYGASWGGYFALRGMLTAPELFKAGYAQAPGALEEEAVINEPNLGLPAENPAGYAAGDNLALAANLRGTLRLVHGTSDVNASLSTTMRMARALIEAGKHFELLLMPGEPHSPQGPAARYVAEDVWRFFARELGGPR
jgi:dipeptidyl aminopeptidase/acylaminoacyl peptidase